MITPPDYNLFVTDLKRNKGAMEATVSAVGSKMNYKVGDKILATMGKIGMFFYNGEDVYSVSESYILCTVEQ